MEIEIETEIDMKVDTEIKMDIDIDLDNEPQDQDKYYNLGPLDATQTAATNLVRAPHHRDPHVDGPGRNETSGWSCFPGACMHSHLGVDRM